MFWDWLELVFINKFLKWISIIIDDEDYKHEIKYKHRYK